jgi:hypothetical protein
MQSSGVLVQNLSGNPTYRDLANCTRFPAIPTQSTAWRLVPMAACWPPAAPMPRSAFGPFPSPGELTRRSHCNFCKEPPRRATPRMAGSEAVSTWEICAH